MDFKKNYKPIFQIVFILGLSVFFSSASCDPEPKSPDSKTIHYVINNTTEDIVLTILPTRFAMSDSVFSIQKGDTILVRRGGFSSSSTYSHSFDGVFFYGFSEEVDINACVYSKDSIVLKTWNRFYTDSTQKQFFKESDWKKKEYEKEEGMIYKYHEYTFTINQDDI